MTADLVATYYAPGEFPDGTGTVMDQVTELGFLADLRGPGSATIEQMNVAATRPGMGGIITIDVLGAARVPTRAFAAYVTKDAAQTIAEMEAEERTRIEIPGHLAVTENGIIGPPNGDGSLPIVDTVAFNWTHPGFDDSGWDDATVISSSYQVQSTDLSGVATPWAGNNLLAWYAEMAPLTLWQRGITGNPFIPAGPPDDTPILGPSDGTITGVADPNAAHQNHYIRQHISLAVGGRASVHPAADDSMELHVDQALITTQNDWKRDDYEFLDITPGDHLVAVMLQNVPRVTNPNPCGMSWTMWTDYFPNATLLARSDSSAKILEYQAEPPGMTITQALRLAFAPHVDLSEEWASAIAGAWTFDDVNGTDGNPMPIAPNLTAQCKDTLGTLIAKIQQSYADVILDPSGWDLRVYDFDSFAPASGLVLTPGVNITTLGHNREKKLADRLHILTTALGWVTVGTGETEAYVELGTEVSAGDVDRIGNQILSIYGQERLEITATYQPRDDSEIPWVNPLLVPGAIATAPDKDGDPTDERILTLGCAISENAESMQVTITLKDRIQELNERIVTELTQ